MAGRKTVPEILNDVFDSDSQELKATYKTDGEVLNLVHDESESALRVRLSNPPASLPALTAPSVSGVTPVYTDEGSLLSASNIAAEAVSLEWEADGTYTVVSGMLAGSADPTITLSWGASGSYNVRVRAKGDGVTYSDSPWSGAFSVVVEQAYAPDKPSNISPASGAVDIQETPTLTSSDYSGLNPAMYARFQIASDSGFSTLAYDSGQIGYIAQCNVPSGNLSANSTYYWRVAYTSDSGLTSEWSDYTSFTTASAFEYVSTPFNQSPPDASVDTSTTLSLSSSAFSVSGTTDTHSASQWQITDVSGDYTSTVWDSGEDPLNLVSVSVPFGALSPNTSYYWRVRHKGSVLGWSEYSSETSFATADTTSGIIGLALVTPGGGSGTWAYVDEQGNSISPTSSTFDSHPVWGGITDVTIDSQEMVRIPKFYYKVAAAPTGSEYEGKKCWWISDTPEDGFSVHPAFVDAGVEIEQFYVGKYNANDDGGTMLGSTYGVLAMTDELMSTFITKAEARNTGGVDGFHMWTIYEIGAIQMLCLIETGTPDVQSAIDPGNSNGSEIMTNGSTGAVWRGLYELWGNCIKMCEGFKSDTSGYLHILENTGTGNYVNTGLSDLGSSGWVSTVHDSTGAGFDMSAVFIPASVQSEELNSTFSDFFYPSSSTEEQSISLGGAYMSGTTDGLFKHNITVADATRTEHFATRIAKV
ncbi:hypothetical protein [Limisalsivibrio acetivorans]|uniref:hypothetical protein n=1 Tax=Limisalsivibrio acetivorans TaxID=1304888 RepID=UPI0003B75DD7|nr:hypothetical protein [Limisalsivibrio acetivorans]